LNANDVVANRFYGLVKFLLAPTRNEDMRAFPHEEPRGRQTNPRGAARNDSHFALQFCP